MLSEVISLFHYLQHGPFSYHGAQLGSPVHVDLCGLKRGWRNSIFEYLWRSSCQKSLFCISQTRLDVTWYVHVRRFSRKSDSFSLWNGMSAFVIWCDLHCPTFRILSPHRAQVVWKSPGPTLRNGQRHWRSSQRLNLSIQQDTNPSDDTRSTQGKLRQALKHSNLHKRTSRGESNSMACGNNVDALEWNCVEWSKWSGLDFFASSLHTLEIQDC